MRVLSGRSRPPILTVLAVFLLLAPTRGPADDLEQLRCRIPGVALNAAAYSPDGRWYVAGADDLVLFDAATRAQRRILNPGEPGTALALAFWPDSASLGVLYLSLRGNGREVARVSVPDGKVLQRFPVLEQVDSNVTPRLAVHRAGDRVAVSNRNGIAVYEAGSGRVAWEWRLDTAANPNRSYAAFDVTPDWRFFLFNLQRIAYPSGKAATAPRWAEDRPFFWGNLISPDGERAVAFGGANGTTKKLFDLESGDVVREVTTKQGMRRAVVDSGFRTLIGDRGLWDLDDGKVTEGTVYTNFDLLESLALAPDDQELTVGNIRTTLAGFAATKPNQGDGSWMQDSAAGHRFAYFFAPDSEAVFFNRGVFLIRPEGGPSVDLTTGTWGEVVHGSQLGYGLAAVARDLTMAVDDRMSLVFAEGAGRAPVALLPERVRSKAFRWRPIFGGTGHVALVSEAGFTVYDIARQTLGPFHDMPLGFNRLSLALSEDGTRLAIVDGDWNARRIAVYDTISGEPVVEPADWTINARTRLAFAGGDRFLVKAYAKTLEVWDTASWQPAFELSLETGRVADLDVSGSGELALVTNTNGRAEVFDLAKREKIATLLAVFANPPAAVFIGAAGKSVSSTGAAGDQLFFSD